MTDSLSASAAAPLCRALVGRLENDLAAVKGALARLEDRRDQPGADRAALGSETDALRVRVAELDTRVKDLEARFGARWLGRDQRLDAGLNASLIACSASGAITA